jgi:hypothetical protein
MNNDYLVLRLRQVLGWMGILLPIFDAVSCLVFGGSTYLPSISGTHYLTGYLLFEGLVFCTGLFLITYRGYDTGDAWMTTVAGIGAVLLTLMPCSFEKADGIAIGNQHNWLALDYSITNIFHLIGAITFFVMLFVIIEFQFPKTSESSYVRKGTKKADRNLIYRICGITMAAGLIFAFIPLGLKFGPLGQTYVGEAIALWSFGVAWLVKGDGIIPLRDNNLRRLKLWSTK